MNSEGTRITNLATYSSDTGISAALKEKAQLISQFEVMFKHLLNLRAGIKGNINIDSVFAIFREGD